ncbi:MAG: tRNA 2-thiouridine(34) synthase MnmA [Thermoguttaceae bacterium]|jgi:tRNA-specific 2-thiouridylase
MSRVVLAMSGGVDSSVAAWLLQEAGHEVIGLFMRHGLPAEARKQGCCSVADAADARRTALRLGIPFYSVDFQHEFDRIVRYFVAEYTAGRTPNPCVVCNTWLKFGKLFEYADSVGAQWVATGHYARLLAGEDGQAALYRGCDAAKDQSYVLWGIHAQRLPRLLFPVGQHHKGEIRRIARRLGLDHLADKPDSQEICFVPDGDHARLVRRQRGAGDASGEIVLTDGTVVGRHDGLERFTVGQRRGLRIAFGEPRYVVRLERATRRVVVGTREELARRELTASGANWLALPPEAGIAGFTAEVKIRYRSPPIAAVVDILPSDRFRVKFQRPCYGVAPGQAAVCYQGDRVLGGGWIE